MLRYFKLWLSIGWLMVIAVCYISLTPSPPDLYIEFEHLDKFEHLISYFILMFWFSQLYKTNKTRLIFVLLFVSMGVVLEILQGLGGVRYFEYYDMLANSFGVVFAWLMTRGKLQHLLFFLEKNIFV